MKSRAEHKESNDNLKKYRTILVKFGNSQKELLTF